MSWNLTEDEQSSLMDAVRGAIKPWLVSATGSFKARWHISMVPDRADEADKDGYVMVDVPHRGLVISDEAPEEIKALDRVYEDVITKAATIP